MSKKSTAAIAPPEPTKPAWPQVTETRQLACRLKPQELAEKSDEMARHQIAANEIEARRKSCNSQFKAQLDEKAAQLSGLAQVITDRSEYRSVKCEWRFEQAGFDAEFKPIYHPEKKTLVRLDSGESVEVREITESERQMKLNLENEVESAELAGV